MSRSWLQLRIFVFILLFLLLTIPTIPGQAFTSWKDSGRPQAAATATSLPAGTVPTLAPTATATSTTTSTPSATPTPTSTSATTATVTPTPAPSETPGRAAQPTEQRIQTATPRAPAIISPTPSATPLPAPTSPLSQLLTTSFLVLGGISGLAIIGAIIFLIVRPRAG